MRARTSGFTLLEVLVALTVAGAAVSMAYAALGVVTDAASRSRAAAEPALAAATARATLDAWLRGATLRDGTVPFQGIHRMEGPSPSDHLTFAVSNGGPLWSGPQRVRVWVDNDPLTSARGLVVEVTSLGNSRLATPDTLELAPAAVGLTARYLVVENDREHWVAEWVSESQLPSVIELRISVLAGARLGAPDDANDLSPLLTIPIVAPVTLERF